MTGIDYKHLYVPCPRCGHMQTLRFRQGVKWHSGHASDAWYVCEGCATIISDAERPAMIAAGETRLKQAGHQDGNVALYTKGFGETAEAFVASSRELTELKLFVEEWLGDKWTDLPPPPEGYQRPTVTKS